jgi:hypothetical protein
MKLGVIVLILAVVALMYYLVSMDAQGFGSDFSQIPIEGIQ